MKTIEIIRSLIKKDLERGLKKIDIARKVGISHSTLWSYMNSDVTPDFNTIKLFAAAYGLPADYFREGALPSPAAPQSSHTPDTIPVLVMNEGNDRGFYSELGSPVGIDAPRVTRPEGIEDPQAYGIQVRGDEMAPKFEDGDTVICAPRAAVKSKDYVVTLIDGTVLLRRIRFTNDLVIFESINPASEPVIVPKDKVSFVHRVVWTKLR
jgi:phage repressor protein C with HTH and peptisase S24 domain